MSHAVLLRQPGPPENFSWEDVAVPLPGPGEAQLQQTAAGINFIDTQFRSGLYKVGDLPAILGREGAGTVVAVGDGVTEVKVGERAAYASQMGAYTEVRNVRADRLVVLPDSIADETAAAMMLKGLTAQYLVRQVRAPVAGDVVLVHAAAGGVGLIACQWAKHMGATVIGTVGSDSKIDTARVHGCDHVVNYESEDFAARVKEITQGHGADAILDSVGLKTFEKSMAALAPFGTLSHYGSASGAVPAELFARLPMDRYFIRPTLPGFSAKREDLLRMADDLFAAVTSGAVKIEINQTFDLRDAAEAHTALETRQTTGSTVLRI
ncbi:MAG TPA: quinone oxidoreductase [Alphaproteobacteria bacterium]|nr:quinone oxidoreductase [Alphaproteobacteria bacterium]